MRDKRYHDQPSTHVAFTSYSPWFTERAGRESNPHHLVLETSALPIELPTQIAGCSGRRINHQHAESADL